MPTIKAVYYNTNYKKKVNNEEINIHEETFASNLLHIELAIPDDMFNAIFTYEDLKTIPVHIQNEKYSKHSGDMFEATIVRRKSMPIILARCDNIIHKFIIDFISYSEKYGENNMQDRIIAVSFIRELVHNFYKGGNRYIEIII